MTQLVGTLMLVCGVKRRGMIEIGSLLSIAPGTELDIEIRDEQALAELMKMRGAEFLRLSGIKRIHFCARPSHRQTCIGPAAGVSPHPLKSVRHYATNCWLPKPPFFPGIPGKNCVGNFSKKSCKKVATNRCKNIGFFPVYRE